MSAPKQSPKTEKDLSERQHYWLKHIRAAEGQGEPLKTYAKRLGLSEHSMYEAKRRLRAYGLIAPAAQGKTAPPRFTRVAMASSEASPGMSLRVRLASGVVLEWGEAPQGDALRELVDFVT